MRLRNVDGPANSAASLAVQGHDSGGATGKAGISRYLEGKVARQSPIYRLSGRMRPSILILYQRIFQAGDSRWLIAIRSAILDEMINTETEMT